MSKLFLKVFIPELTNTQQFVWVLQAQCKYTALTPFKYGECDPVRNRFEPAKVKDIAARYSSNVFYWIGAMRGNGGSIAFRQGRGRHTACISMWFDNAEKLDDPKCLSSFMCDLVNHFGASYGYIHCLAAQESEMAGVSVGITPNGPDSYTLSISRSVLVQCLPDLYWGNVFGAEYVTLFGGCDRVASIHTAMVSKLEHGAVYIQLSDNMLDCAAQYSKVDATRKVVKQFLGADCFFDPNVGAKGSYRVPRLGWEEPLRPLVPPVLRSRDSDVQRQPPVPTPTRVWSASFDLDDVEPFLRRIRPHIQAGLDDSDVAHVMSVIRMTNVGEERMVSVGIRYRGSEVLLQIQVFMDDVQSPSLYITGPQEFCKQLALEMEAFLRDE